LEKYVQLAKELGMVDALIISPKQICFDDRVVLKCKWGCEQKPVKCDPRGTSYSERVEMLKKYKHILLIHAHSGRDVTKALLELERKAFLDGYYLTFAMRYCNFCEECQISKGEACAFPQNVRPCEGLFGVDVIKTVRNLGLPINILKSKDEIQNRYGFLLID
jgi:predicted metal-binding protein